MKSPVLGEKCGVVGIQLFSDSFQDYIGHLVRLSLYALQHRGQESAGIAILKKTKDIYLKTGMGLVSEVLEGLSFPAGNAAIGHVRYSTAGTSSLKSAQPLLVDTFWGQIAVSHNGNITNVAKIKEFLSSEGAVFSSDSDTEVVLHLLNRSRGMNFYEAVASACSSLKGSFSFVFLWKGGLIAARDYMGIRPLEVGRFQNGWVVASETHVFDTIGATPYGEVPPGTVAWFTPHEMKVLRYKKAKSSFCVFEYIYFARPDAVFRNISVYEVRKRMGQLLARQAPVNADIVIPLPDSGVPAALGFAQELGIKLEMAMVRNRYIGRTFIQPFQKIRAAGVHIKFNPVKKVLSGKRVVVVDDSIVRGTTMKRVVENLRKSGAVEVHVRIASPPIKFPCFYGIDMPTFEELVASYKETDEVCKEIGADSLHYLSIENLVKAVGREDLCLACLNGNYPEEVEDANIQRRRCGYRQGRLIGKETEEEA